MKKVLVTGGAGFIGSAILPELQRLGHEVFVIDNLSFGKRAHISVPDSHFFEIDILEKQALAAVVHQIQPEWVIHLAAVHFIPYCNQHPFESANINLSGTANVLDAAAGTASVKKVFFASTAAVYPIYDTPISEEMPTGPLDIYGLSKLMGERLCSEFYLATGIPTIICRFFNAFGPNETNPHLIPEIERQLVGGARTIALGNLEPKRDFIHTHDMARAVVALLTQIEAGTDTFNLGRGIEYAVTEIVEAFEAAMGEKITIEQDPARVRKTDRMHLLANVDKLRTRTGWEPQIGIEEGISRLLQGK